MNEYIYGVLKDNGIAVKMDENIGIEFFEMSKIKQDSEVLHEHSDALRIRERSENTSHHSSVQREQTDHGNSFEDSRSDNAHDPSVDSEE